MSEILKRSEIDDLLDRIINSTDDWKSDVDTLLAHDAALRLALAEATRDRDDNANVIIEQNKLWADRCEAAEARALAAEAKVASLVSQALSAVRGREAAERERDEARAVMDADDRRLREAAVRVWGEHVRGCDTPDAMADLIEHLRAERDAAPSRARETEDGAVREAKERLWDALDRESLGGTYLAARGLRAALSTPAPAPPADAATEAVRDIDNLCFGCEVKADPEVPSPAPAPSAKETK